LSGSVTAAELYNTSACGGRRVVVVEGGERLALQFTARRPIIQRETESKEERTMSTKKPASRAQQLIGDIAPKLADLTDDVLFGDVWERPQLSKRDRSLITCAALVATGKTEQMTFHFPRAIENGVTQEELVEMITHLAFYVGWPSAMSAAARAKELLAKKQP
jgi:4-carboxymuconolactone decarboxylase